MTPLPSSPESSTHEKSAQRGSHHTKTHKKETSKGGGSKAHASHAERVVKAAEGVTDSHTDARTTQHKANTHRRSGAHERDGKVSEEEAGKHFSLTKLLATPFFLLGGALSAAGGVLFGVGSVVKGIGHGGE